MISNAILATLAWLLDQIIGRWQPRTFREQTRRRFRQAGGRATRPDPAGGISIEDARRRDRVLESLWYSLTQELPHVC